MRIMVRYAPVPGTGTVQENPTLGLPVLNPSYPPSILGHINTFHNSRCTIMSGVIQCQGSETCPAPSVELLIQATGLPLKANRISPNWKTQMTLSCSVDVISKPPSLVNWILLIDYHFDVTNSETTV